MKSEFKFAAYLTPVGFILVIVAPLIIVSNSMINISPYLKIFMGVYAPYLLYRAFVMIQNKFAKIRFDGRVIIRKGFYGLGSAKKYDVDDFDGFRTFWVTERGGNAFENLDLVVKGKSVIMISNRYYSNYAELKQQIESTDMPELATNSEPEARGFISAIKRVF